VLHGTMLVMVSREVLHGTEISTVNGTARQLLHGRDLQIASDRELPL